MLESVSRRTFGGSSGTYNVRASELARNRGRHKTLSVTVVFLDDSQHTFQIEVRLSTLTYYVDLIPFHSMEEIIVSSCFQKHAKGSVLLENVHQHLELIERDYFGLQFTENGAAPSQSNNLITV